MTKRRLIAGLLASPIIVLVLLEVLFQLAALLVKAPDHTVPTNWFTHHVRVLCVGDSNTYGLYVERDQAYPARLQIAWNKAHQDRQIEVLNLGYPGTNSSKLRNSYPAMLETFKPDLVLILVGANDFWTDTVHLNEDSATVLEAFVNVIRAYSRVYKLVYMIQQSTYDADKFVPAPEPKPFAEGTIKREGIMRYGDKEFTLGYSRHVGGQDSKKGEENKAEKVVAALKRNLSGITEDTQQFGAKPIFLSYASSKSYYGLTNKYLDQVAKQQGIPFIDLSKSLNQQCRDRKCEEYFFKDQHPTVKGYQIVAATVAQALGSVLK